MEHLTDAPAANILILAGLIFLQVAILGRIGGWLGKLFGPAREGRKSRALSGLLGLALVAGGITLHLLRDATAHQVSPSVQQSSAPSGAPMAQISAVTNK